MSDGPRSIRVVAGSPTDEETAAIAALFSTLLLEQAVAALPLPTQPVRGGWERHARPIRAPLPRGSWQDG